MISFNPITEELAVCEFDGGQMKRIYSNGEYSFSVDSIRAAEAVREYAIKEEIPLVYTDVAPELLGELLSKFRHADIDAQDAARSLYRVRVKSEAQLLSELPAVECGGVELSPILREDIPEYFRLSTDMDTNKYWSYDYREDNAEADGEYFFLEQLRDFERGAAITLAVRAEGKFIGEAALYGFDLAGGANIALRLLPEWRSRGFGSLALEAVFTLAEDIGLISLYAEVNRENLPSLALFSSYMDKVGERGETVLFALYAEEE